MTENPVAQRSRSSTIGGMALPPITINPNRIDLDEAYLSMAEIWGKRSKANRLQVGALIVKDKQIISDGYNGMPSGATDDVCELWDDSNQLEFTMRTKREVQHAESNALMKISENGGIGAQGATLYTTWSPCFECSKLIKQAKIRRVVYRNHYRDDAGIKMLRDFGVEVVQLGDAKVQVPPPPAPPAPAPQLPPTPAPTVPAPPPLVASPGTPSEDEVAALLARHQATIAQQAAAKAGLSAPVEPPAGPYKSSFA